MTQHLRDALRTEYELAHDTLRPEGATAVQATAARRRRRWTGAAAAVLALTLTGGVAAWRFAGQGQGDDPDRPELAVAGACPRAGFDAAVFLRSDVTELQTDEVRRALLSSPEIFCLGYESRDEAWERFKQQFRDAPDLVAATKKDSLPESFRFRIARVADSGRIEQRITPLGGVSDYVCSCVRR